MKKTWYFWIQHNGETCGRYYNFKTFKVYWAYKWYIAEQTDKKGVLSGTDKTCTKIIYTNYGKSYK